MSPTPTPHLVLLLWGGELAAWSAAPGLAPSPVKLQGELRLSVSAPNALCSAVADAAERLRGQGLELGHVHWLADAPGRSLWQKAQPQVALGLGQAAWQLLAWEWLAERLGWGQAAPWATLGTRAPELFAWLHNAEPAAERQHMLQSLALEHQSAQQRLQAEHAALERQNERLSAQNAALQQVDTERLLSYLPALFARAFTVLGAADLALLCGRIEPLRIENPYPEPSEETLRTLQKRFRELPPALQSQIVGFVADLPQRQKLQVRPEMRELLQQLEGG